jgi:signal transduction histidine kinase/ActR/RegA family two-component response regulator
MPIQWREEFLGVLTIADRSQRYFMPEDAILLSQFATQAASAIQNARLHEETQKYAQQLQHILDTVQEGILLLDDRYCVQLANPLAREYLTLLADATIGDTLTHLGGKPLSDILASTDDRIWQEIVLSDPLPRVFDVATRPTIAPFTIAGWVIVLRDVTRERNIQARAQQQDRLAAVGQLAAGIAHDFNNILTSIIGYTELAKIDSNLSEMTKKDLERVVRQSQRASHLIRQILDFSRQSIIEKRPLDIGSLIKEFVKLLRRVISENIQLSLKIEPGPAAYILRGDPTQIQQTLTNLALNAQDAMPEGGLLQFRLTLISVSAGGSSPSPELSPGDWIALSVSDTGTGIPLEVRPRIFEPFFTTKEVGRGTGLGLAQVYGIVKQHEGHVELETHEGKGTTFILYFPALASRPELPAQVTAEEVPHGHGEMILLVEDDPAVLRVTKSMLEYLGYQVLAATNGREALAVYQGHKDEIVLVMTDATMPEIGGVALTKALHEQEIGLKTLILSGYPLESEQEARELLAQGSVDWLQKPLNLAQLAQAVSQLLQT